MGGLATGTPPLWLQFADAALDRLSTTLGEVSKRRGGLDRGIGHIRDRFVASLEEPAAFSALVHNAGLSIDEAEVLAVAAAIEADPARQLVVARVQGNDAGTRLTLHTVAALFPGDHLGVRAVGPDAALRRAALIDVIERGPWASHEVVVRAAVMWALAGDQSRDPDLPVGTEFVVGEETAAEGHPLVAVTGDDRVRRLQEAMRSLASHRLLVTREPAQDAEWAALVREATIVGAGIVVELEDDLPADGRRWIERATHLRWGLSSRIELPVEQMPNRPWIDRHAEAHEPTDEEWAAALGDQPRAHHLTAAQLWLVERTHAASGGDLHASVRRLAGGHIDRLARRIRPTRGWDDLVLSPDRLQLLRELVARYRHTEAVYDNWGFTASPSRGQVALFSGPSGTGKTLAAEIIAGDLELDLFKLDLAAVVSKWIGESEKDVDRVFDAASAGNVVLFFDEADALFGRRSEVTDAHDRYTDIEVSYLLQRLEAYRGVVVLATSSEGDIDEAFVARVDVRVEFALPDEAERKAIWDHNLPQGAPLDADVDTSFLARQFELSGGSIRSAAVQGAFLAAASGASIDMACLIRGVARELQKIGRPLRPDAFGPYFPIVAR